jgi:DNA-3-methyladenine glycosylase
MTAAENLLEPRPPLDREFYSRPVCTVATELLGKLLYRRTPEGLVSGRIVEVEAYLGSEDPASHAYRGPTKRNASMFGPAGHAYVYTIHARFCMNVVAERVGVAHAILIRAVEPLVGLDLMRRRRKVDNLRDLARGPARLCEAFALDRRMDGWDLTTGRDLWLAEDDCRMTTDRIAVTPRIGVTSAKESLLRYIVSGNLYVSGPARLRVGQSIDSFTINP